MTMMTINITDLDIYAYHGVYEQERRTGQPFRLQCALGYETADTIRGLDQTIDYTGVIDLIRTVMSDPEDLLETVAMKIAERIRSEHPIVRHVDISIEKSSPPIPQFSGRVGVRFRKDYL
jgi:dihydroneopterin aldolase